MRFLRILILALILFFYDDLHMRLFVDVIEHPDEKADKSIKIYVQLLGIPDLRETFSRYSKNESKTKINGKK